MELLFRTLGKVNLDFDETLCPSDKAEWDSWCSGTAVMLLDTKKCYTTMKADVINVEAVE